MAAAAGPAGSTRVRVLDHTLASSALRGVCHHCGDVLQTKKEKTSAAKELPFTGLQCEYCHLLCHEECSRLLVAPCSPASPFHQRQVPPNTHTWYQDRATRGQYCNVCRGICVGNIVTCSVCGYVAHEHCEVQAHRNCRPAATYTDSEPTSSPSSHWWLEGNLRSKAACVVCEQPCNTSDCLTGFRCTWCNSAAHSRCFVRIPANDYCTRGAMGPLVLPPAAVSYQAPYLFKPSGRRASIDDVGKAAAAAVAAVQLTSTIDLRLYCSRPGFHCSLPLEIKLGESTRARAAVEMALALLNVGDPADTYYLQEVIMQSAQLASEPLASGHALPEDPGPLVRRCLYCDSSLPDMLTALCTACASFPDMIARCRGLESRLMSRTVADSEDVTALLAESLPAGMHKAFHLRSHAHDGQFADQRILLRVYAGPELLTDYEFVTIPITPAMTVADMVDATWSKFKKTSLAEIPLDELVVDEARCPKGVGAAVVCRLADTDQPFTRVISFRASCMHDGRYRLVLRGRRALPSQPVDMFITKTPPSCSEGQFSHLLRSLVPHATTQCSLDVFNQAKGFAIVRCNTGEIASQLEFQLGLLTGAAMEFRLLPVLHDELLRRQPLLVFVNSRSGGGQGTAICRAAQRLFNAHQVFDLTQSGPVPGLCVFRRLRRCHVMVAGGDGTVNWVLNSIGEIKECCPQLRDWEPAVGIIPVGTGNDLSRVLGWGPGYEGEDIEPYFLSGGQGTSTFIDRWDVKIESSPAGTVTAMTNYLGIGIDADVALKFHNKRNECPSKFKSRVRNKSHYVTAGMTSLVEQPCKDLPTFITLTGDGRAIPLTDLQGIIVLNIGSYGAGADAWGRAKDKDTAPATFNDGLVEVVGVNGVVHLSHIGANLRPGRRLGQFREIVIACARPVPVQVDGEPWMQAPGIITIRRKEQATVILNVRPERRSIFDRLGQSTFGLLGGPDVRSARASGTSFPVPVDPRAARLSLAVPQEAILALSTPSSPEMRQRAESEEQRESLRGRFEFRSEKRVPRDKKPFLL